MKNEETWPFDEERNVAVFPSTHIFRDNRPILRVSHHEEDGAWQFHSGDPTEIGDVMVVALDEVLEHDSTIADLADLPPGWCAERAAVDRPWTRHPNSSDPD
jgi:hypothetical protein